VIDYGAIDYSPLIADNSGRCFFLRPFFMRACAIRSYTLFEVLIVLALLSTILMLISAALDIHVRQMAINRTEVEVALLARTIINIIEKDILSVIISIREENLEVDASALAAVMGLEGAAGILEGLDELLEGNEEGEGEYYDDDEEPLIYGTIPGIYGSFDWIQIDTAKLPRGELHGSRQIRRGTSLAADRLSASKTVLYYLGADTGNLTLDDPRYQPEKLIGSVGRSLDSAVALYGLFRRQMDRQATQYALQEGLGFEYEQDDEPLAPEVEWIEFAYFDPTINELGTTGDWITEWDMDERLALPLAVEIRVAIRRPNVKRSWFSVGTQEATPPVIYSKIVMIPVTTDLPYVAEEEYDEGMESE
jgi:hypothetical protein